MLVRFGWLWTMKKFSNRFLKKKPMEFGSWTTREILIASFAGVRGAITLAGVLSIPLLLPDGNVFPARYELVFLAAGVILFSLFVGVVMLPILLQHIEVADHSQQLKEERIARAATAVRGAITLAGVLSIPLLLPDGNVFPARYELVFLAAGVILFSLFVGVVM